MSLDIYRKYPYYMGGFLVTVSAVENFIFLI